MNNLAVSAIIPVYNVSSTIHTCLDSLKEQTVKVKEIILVDNKSLDDSVMQVEKYRQKNKDLSIKILKKPKTTSVASSYNMALKISKGELILTMHSDSSLPTGNELEKLIEPLIKDKEIVATYSYVLHPKEIWDSYNFWEKCQSCRVVDKEIPAMNGKFDCYRKEILLKLHGFDDVNFDQYGDGNDADIYYRLKTIGEVVETPAKVVHLHYLKDDYSLFDWLEKRKNMSITSGRLLKMYKNKTNIKGIVSFSIRPVLAIIPFIPGAFFIGIATLVLFSFLYSPRMFTTIYLWKDLRLYTLPLINIFLVYFESFWFLYTLFTHEVKIKRSL